MANKQIYELTTRTFDGDSLLPISVENPDSSTATEYPQLAGKTSGNALSDFVANDQQYATDLDTENKTITGAINELHSSIGANTYNTSSTYNKGDIVIYNGTLYACNGTSVTGAWDATKWDATTLQPKTDNTLATTDKTVVGAINELKSGSEYKVGDSINIGDCIVTGFLTNSQKNIAFQIPLSKPISSNVNNITINSNCLWQVRHISGGYILNSQKLSDFGSVTITKNSIGIMILAVASSSFTGAPNNTPIVGSVVPDTNSTISFS